MKYILLLASILLLSNCKEEKVEKPIPIRPVKSMVVHASGATDQHSFSGSAQAREEANLSFRVAGTINKIYAKIGDRVSRGQLLATIEATDYQVGLQQATAQAESSVASEQSAATQIKSAEANYIASKSAYERMTSLYENNSVSLSQFEQAKASYEAAEASYNASKSQYEAAKFGSVASEGQKKSAQNQVSYTKLTAPFSGVITQKQQEENQLVASGTPVLTINTIGKPEVNVGVPELLISKIKKGAEVYCVFSTISNKTFKGKVKEVGYSPGAGATYPVIIDLLESDDAIRPGMPANVTFSFALPSGEQKQIVVPTSAVGEDTKGRFVMTLNPKGDDLATVKKTYVTIGKLRNNGFEIKQGLSDGQRIASAGLNILLEGDEVKILSN